MTGEEKYNVIYNSLNDRVSSGELTLEQANLINEAAYQKYVVFEQEVSSMIAPRSEIIKKDSDYFLKNSIIENDNINESCFNIPEKNAIKIDTTDLLIDITEAYNENIIDDEEYELFMKFI